MKNAKKSNRRLLLVLLAAAPLLAACSSDCHCNKCPGTTVVTPDHSTVYTPSE